MGQPREVAALVRLLASADGGYINGQMLQVNGGAETCVQVIIRLK